MTNKKCFKEFIEFTFYLRLKAYFYLLGDLCKVFRPLKYCVRDPYPNKTKRKMKNSIN